MQQTDEQSEVFAYIDWCFEQADVIAWNELGTVALRNYVLRKAGWESFMPGAATGPTSSANSVAISWRTDVFRQDGAGTSEQTHGGVLHITPGRFINTVPLAHVATGKPLDRQSTHSVHHVDVGGKARIKGALLGQNARAKTHFAKLAASIVAHGTVRPLLGSGDLNVDYFAEKHLAPSARTPWFPLTVLGQVATLVVPNHGTHGGRLIDWGWTTGDLRIVSCVALPRGSSDHNAVLTVVEL